MTGGKGGGDAVALFFQGAEIVVTAPQLLFAVAGAKLTDQRGQKPCALLAETGERGAKKRLPRVGIAFRTRRAQKRGVGGAKDRVGV